MNINTEKRLWENRYKIDEPTIDSQHYQLFHKIDRLFYFVNKGDLEKQKKECMETINFLVDYTITHFNTEEAYQRKVKYCDYERHKKLHEQFKDVIDLYYRKLTNDFSQKTLESFLGTLLIWLITHVYICDKKIATNEPILDDTKFNTAETFVKKVFTDLYNIKLLSVEQCLYKGFVNEKVFIRTHIRVKEKQHIFVYAMSERFAKAIFCKASTLELDSFDNIGEFELSCLEEIAETISAYTAEIVSKNHAWSYLDGKLFIETYNENKYDFSDSSTFKVETEFGNMEMLYLVV
ncbi:MAG: hemerythrin family protein [Clostridium sp.]|nr:hemerythrin family protein [Clostridium sp.]MCM1547370.1 hemerythrin family protein [Ruminococcus sp.]